VPYLRGVDPSLWLSSHQYYKHIGIYGYRADVLGEITKLPPGKLEVAESLEQLRWLENGYTIRVAETTIETIGIDTPSDLKRAELYLKTLKV
jgi:3-deoxy-manno-octulosonate cytidylyltransferase (CMP-KDO synthetase)